jgi:hypothetical protein
MRVRVSRAAAGQRGLELEQVLDDTGQRARELVRHTAGLELVGDLVRALEEVVLPLHAGEQLARAVQHAQMRTEHLVERDRVQVGAQCLHVHRAMRRVGHAVHARERRGVHALDDRAHRGSCRPRWRSA